MNGGSHLAGTNNQSPDRILAGTYRSVASLARDVHPRVLILPARDEPDEIAGIMLAHILRQAGYEAECVTTNVLATEMAAAVARANPDLTIISTTPPSATSHATYLLKKLDHVELGTRRPPMFLAVWNGEADPRRLARRLSPDAPIMVVTTLPAAVEQARQLTAHVTSPKREGSSERASAATATT